MKRSGAKKVAWECGRKKRYPNSDHAEQSIASRQMSDTHVSYLCKHCGFWHVGRPKNFNRKEGE